MVVWNTPPKWPPQRLSLALQGGGTFAAFTWGVLERLLEHPTIEIDSISGASAGAINALLLASGFAEGGREGARARLNRFWIRLMHEASFRSLMLVGGFSPAGSSVAFGPTLRSGHFDPFDLDPLRQALLRDINFAALRDANCPRLLIAATRIRDGQQQIFGNDAVTADVALASTCPPLFIARSDRGEAYWEAALAAIAADQAGATIRCDGRVADQLTPSRDSYVPSRSPRSTAGSTRLRPMPPSMPKSRRSNGPDRRRCPRCGSPKSPRKIRSTVWRSAHRPISAAASSACCIGAAAEPPSAGSGKVQVQMPASRRRRFSASSPPSPL